MYNATIKFISSALIISGAILFDSCNNKSSDRLAAEKLATEARAMLDAGNPESAARLLDSLQNKYPTEIEVQREGMSIRPLAIEKITIKELQTADSLMAEYAALHEKMVPLMKKIDSKELVEPYYVPNSGYKPSFMTSTSIQPRVDMIGQFYFLSSVNGRKLNHTSFSLTSANGRVDSPVVNYDGETNYRIDGTELITYPAGACDSIGIFANENLSTPVTLIFNGDKGSTFKCKLSNAEVKGIADAYNYSQSIVRSRDLAVEKEKLERKLQIARDQAARTAIDK